MVLVTTNADVKNPSQTPKEEMERRDHLQTLERGLAVLVAFAGADGPWMSASELAGATSLSVSTVRRVLLTLERLGYARSESNRYALTPKVLGIGYAYLSSVNLIETAHPLMETLTEKTGVGTSLATLDGRDVVYIDRVQRRRITSIVLAVGVRLPAHATSMGHILLADLNAPELTAYLNETPLQPLTHATITDPAALRERVDEVRRRGWGIVDQELEIGRRSAAAPVRDATGQVIAALSLSCGTAEFSAENLQTDLVPKLCETAAEISQALGYAADVARLDSNSESGTANAT
jgi:IclR family transcriptional regulator, pca regulon regulatory protein